MNYCFTGAIICAIGLHGAAFGQGAIDGLRPWLEVDGAPADATGLHVERDGDSVTLSFVAPRKGTYRVGFALEADELTPLAPGLDAMNVTDVAEPLVLRYPYDWSSASKRNVLNMPRLALPGLLTDAGALVVDTRELWSLQLRASEDGRVRALLLAHRYRNDGFDVAGDQLMLGEGERVTLRVEQFPGLEEATESRSGVGRGISGRMMQVAYRGWTAQSYGPEQYRHIADACQDVYDWIIVREIGTHDWIPPILHERGIKAMAYQYLGALRRHSAQVTEEMPETIGMVDSGGEVYTAPYTPDGPWLLGDIRRPEVREIFVKRAVAAIEAGFDGIFLDGTIFWPDSAGRRGGSVSGAEHSLAWAHWKLLSEIVAAVHKADPEAIVGVLGNDYYDALGETDFVLKERMYFAWDEFAREFNDRRTKVQATLDVGFETGEAPLVSTALVYGVKGFSSIAVQTAVQFVREPTGAWYYGTGDHSPELLDEWVETIVRHVTEPLAITTVEPEDTWLHFYGRDSVEADDDCVIELTVPACIADEDGACLQHEVTTARLEAGRRYRLLMQCPGE